MTDEAGAASAAAEPVSAPAAAPQDGPSAPSPESAATAPAPKDRAREPARASIDRAFAEMDKQEAPAAKPKEPKETKTDAPATGERERDESGRFKAKEVSTDDVIWTAKSDQATEAKTSVEKPAAIASEPPARFSADAKAAWKDAPAAVQSEITRAVKELEGGIREYQGMLEPLKRHMALAKQHNTTVHDALDGYLNVERSLRSQDMGQKLTAIEGIFETAGISPRDYAAHIMGQKPDQVQSQNDHTIRALRAELAALKQEIGGVTTSIQQRREDDVKAQVETFAKEHPRMQDEAFAGVVARFIQTGYEPDLAKAYDLADKLNPLPAPATQPSTASTAVTTPKPNPDQTRKGSLSIAGAPSSGSNPVNRKTPASAREALDRAFAGVGIT